MNTKRAASNIMVNQWHAFIIILSILVFPVIANAQTAGFSWGDNGYGQLGDGTEADESNGFFNVKNIPGLVFDLNDVIAVAAGSSYSLALKSDGTVWSWGDNSQGQLGVGSTISKLTPVQVAGLDNIIAISCGYYHALALKSDGTVWAWGNNSSGQLGDGSFENHMVRVQSMISNVVAIACGAGHSLALTSDGKVWAWGYNGDGQLGDGSYNDSSVPVQVLYLTGITAIVCGSEHSLALKNNGTIWVWGANSDGQLGNGTTENFPFPISLQNILNVDSIYAGGNRSYAVKSDGTVWAFGSGSLGDGTQENRLSPIQITSLTGVVAIAAGGVHTIALKSDGTVWSWGYNEYGSLGDGTYESRLLPVQVLNIENVAAIATGSGHSLAIYSCVTPIPSLIDQINNIDGCGQMTIYFTPGTPATRHDLYADGVLIKSNIESPSEFNAADSWTHEYVIRTTMMADNCFIDSAPYSIACPSYPSRPIITNILDVDQNSMSGIQIFYIESTPTERHDLYMDGTILQPGFVSGSVVQPGDMRMHAYSVRAVNGSCHNDSSMMLAKDIVMAALPDMGSAGAWGHNLNGQLGDGTYVNKNQAIVPQNMSNISAIAGGSSHSLALKKNGTVWAWGDNYYGQLGNGTTISSNLPIQTINISGVSAISCGSVHSLALKSNGSIWAWGANSSGQLGDRTTINRSIPVSVSDIDNVVAVAAGSAHSLALKNDGTVWAWGHNINGQLGDDTTYNRNYPGKVKYLADIVAITAGASHSLALKSDGTVWAWGYNSTGQLGDGTTTQRQTAVQVLNLTSIVAIAAGGSHSLALKGDGTVWTWGSNDSGQLGNNEPIAESHVPIQVPYLTDIINISSGNQHVLALTNDGHIWAWGDNSAGQLGDGSYIDRPSPVQSIINSVSSIAGGGAHSLATFIPQTPMPPVIDSINDNICGGLSLAFTAGSPSTRHDLYIDGVAAISGVLSPLSYTPNDSASHSYVIRAVNMAEEYYADSAPYVFSDENYGPSQPVISSVIDVDPTAMSGILLSYNGGSPATRHDLYIDGVLYQEDYVSGGLYQPGDTKIHSFVIKAVNPTCSKDSAAVFGKDYVRAIPSIAGQAVSWGNNGHGQLGDGTTTQRTSPVQVLNSAEVVQLSGGALHSLALLSDGTIRAWGYNSQGQLGDNTTTQRTTPVQVQNLTEIVQVSGGDSHSLALRVDGSVWAWGYNGYGQLGDGTTTQRKTPVQVLNLTNIVEISAGDLHSLALKSDGTVWAWGNNSSGQLGDGTTTLKTTPVQVINLSGILSIEAGSSHSLAVKNDGSAWAWGINSNGQLGDGTTTQRQSPVQVLNLTETVQVSGGSSHSLALLSDGTVRAWGNNNSGQLGDNTTTQRTIPVLVLNLTGVISIVAGNSPHSLALKGDGTLWAWGNNSNGQLGDGTTTQRRICVQTTSLANFNAIAAGNYHSLAIFSCGTMIAPVITEITDTDPCGGMTITFTSGTPAIRHDLYVDGVLAQSGVVSPLSYNPGDVTEHSYVIQAFNPSASCISNSPPFLFTDSNYYISQAPVITSALDVDGGSLSGIQIIYFSGAPAGQHDLYMDGNLVQENYISGVTYLPGDSNVHTYIVRAINGPCTKDSSAAYAKDFRRGIPSSYGKIAVWGDDYYGQLGRGSYYGRTNIPSQVLNISDAAVVTGGESHSLALRHDGTVWSWGYNGDGELGNSTNTNSHTPVQTTGLSNIVSVASGAYHSLALLQDGTVKSWGYNYYGQLGNGTVLNTNNPIDVAGMADIVAIAAGGSHSLALKNNGTVWAWGCNGNGQLGDGTTTTKNTPVQVLNLTEIVAIAAGYSHSMALKNDGTLWTWGYNAYGQLGNGTTTQASTPVQVSTLTEVKAISAGLYHSLALRSNGTVWAWGFNYYGQLGNGTTVNKTTAVQVTGSADISSIGGGGYHSLAIKNDGTVYAWGYNGDGELGDGTFINRNLAVQISSLANAIQVSGGTFHSLAIVECLFTTDPVIQSITDNDSCQQNGMTITFAFGSPATSHELYKDGVLAQSGVSSPLNYSPGDSDNHNYAIRAVNSATGCYKDSIGVIAADANGTPSQPVIDMIVDNDPTLLSGITLTFSPGSPAIQHDLYKDGLLAQSNYASGATYLPGDSDPHGYVIKAVNGTCWIDSPPMSGTDAFSASVPPEIATGTSQSDAQMWSEDKSTQSWPLEATGTGYKLYRGILEDLQYLLTADNDSCIRYEGGNTSIELSTDDPQALPGRLYWYLVTATNGAGEGPSGNGRIVNSPGNCP